MGERRFDKDWYKNVKAHSNQRRSLELEKVDVTILDQLPQLVSVKEAAQKLNSNHKTVADWMAKGHLKSIKVRGRRFTTPAWMADFLRDEIATHG